MQWARVNKFVPEVGNVTYTPAVLYAILHDYLVQRTEEKVLVGDTMSGYLHHGSGGERKRTIPSNGFSHIDVIMDHLNKFLKLSTEVGEGGDGDGDDDGGNGDDGGDGGDGDDGGDGGVDPNTPDQANMAVEESTLNATHDDTNQGSGVVYGDAHLPFVASPARRQSNTMDTPLPFVATPARQSITMDTQTIGQTHAHQSLMASQTGHSPSKKKGRSSNDIHDMSEGLDTPEVAKMNCGQNLNLPAQGVSGWIFSSICGLPFFLPLLVANYH